MSVFFERQRKTEDPWSGTPRKNFPFVGMVLAEIQMRDSYSVALGMER